MKLRKLRIAFSILCGVFFLSTVALWVYSYFADSFVSKRFTTCIVTLEANRGCLGVWDTSPIIQPGPDVSWEFSTRGYAIGVLAHQVPDEEPVFELFGFSYETIPTIASVLFVPFWALLLPVAVAGMLPWVNWRIGWRAAISAACLIVAVLAVGLWIRSYKWFDITDRTSAINICSMKGRLLFGETFMLTGGDSLNPAAPVPPSHLGICTLTPEKFQLLPMGDGVAVPYWLAVMAIGLVGVAPWLRFRFSLRTMLVAMAVIAVMLLGLLSALKR